MKMECWIFYFYLLLRLVLGLDAESSRTRGAANQFDYEILYNSEPCTQKDEVLIVVASSSKMMYAKRRMALRSTWLNAKTMSKGLKRGVKIAFFLGYSGDRSVQGYIHYESQMYNDMVVGNFVDDYRNNTYKTMGFLRWTAEHCRKAKLLMKIDDDVLLKYHYVDRLQHILDSAIASSKQFYMGMPMDRRPHRNPESKWYVSYHDWPEKLYPLWYQGMAYFLSPGICGDLYSIALQTGYIFTDDVFVGILVYYLQKAKNVVYFSLPNLNAFRPIDNRSAWIQTLHKSWRYDRNIFFHVPNISEFYKWFSE